MLGAAVLCASCVFSGNGFKNMKFDNGKGVECKGPVVVRTLDLSGFDKIVVNGMSDMELVQGENFQVSVKANEEVFDHIDYKVEDGALILETKEQVVIKAEEFDIRITLPLLKSLTVNGAADVDLKGGYSASDSLRVEINGAGDFDFSGIKVPFLRFELNGAYLEAQDGGGLDMSTLKAGHAYAMTPAVIKVKTGDYDHVYVLGTVNGLNWDTNKGVEMETSDGTVYTAIVTVNDSGDDYGYFSFTKKLGATWEDINSSRFGSEASGSYWGVHPDYYNTNLNLRYWSDNSGSFQVPVGTYLLTVTLQNGNDYYAGNLVIKRASAQAPRRKADGDNGYVVYPISMTQITSEENNVVTGVSTVGGDRVAVSRQYVNVAGVRASQPWNGAPATPLLCSVELTTRAFAHRGNWQPLQVAGTYPVLQTGLKPDAAKDAYIDLQPRRHPPRRFHGYPAVPRSNQSNRCRQSASILLQMRQPLLQRHP